MTDAEIKYMRQWLEKAEHDLIAAQLIIEVQPIILDVACFHCQQVVEKYLKAFLIWEKQDFPKTHNLDILLKKCLDINSSFETVDLSNLEDFAVRGRYPHDFISPSIEEARYFYEIALTVKALVRKEIGII